MKEIQRDFYLNQLIKKDGNGQIKVITGIRRSGKSYLLRKIFYQYLLKNNDKDHILYIPLDIKENEPFLNQKLLLNLLNLPFLLPSASIFIYIKLHNTP